MSRERLRYLEAMVFGFYFNFLVLGSVHFKIILSCCGFHAGNLL